MKEIYLAPFADLITCEISDIITASDPYVDDIDWDL